jgi:site-specific DNA-methyltransferase (adenine-specific)
MISKVLFSSNKTEWETPGWLFNELDREFNFTLDVCAIAENAKCKRYFSPEDDGLSQSWQGEVCFMNPPYGREVGAWVQKAYEESRKGAKVVCLLPARTDTAWFHDYIYGKAEIRFLRGRLKFSGAKNSAPFPSMIVIFNSHKEDENCYV